MAINLIVLAATLLLAGFLVVWVAFPRSRGWFEAPKYQPLRWGRQAPPRRPGHRD